MNEVNSSGIRTLQQSSLHHEELEESKPVQCRYFVAPNCSARGISNQANSYVQPAHDRLYGHHGNIFSNISPVNPGPFIFPNAMLSHPPPNYECTQQVASYESQIPNADTSKPGIVFSGHMPTSGKIKAATNQNDRKQYSTEIGPYANAYTSDGNLALLESQDVEQVAAQIKGNAELRESELTRLRLKSLNQHSDMKRQGHIFLQVIVY